MWKQCEKCEQNVKHVEHIFRKYILKMWNMHFNNVTTCEKCEKRVNKCGNILKNRKLHVLILFLFWTNNNLRSLWTYWHESLNMNICLCGILMFTFNILKLKIGFQRKHEKKTYIWKKRNNGAKKQELFNCLLLPFFTSFPCYSHFSHVQNACFSHFSPSAFSKHIFFACVSHFSQSCEEMWKTEKHFEHALGKKIKCVLNMHLEKKTWKHAKKKTHLNIQLGRWSFDFLGSSFAVVTLLPAQLLQVENPRGAVQINRKWTV